MKLTVEAGLTPETHEFVFLHVHAHLDVFVNGEAMPVPAGIGIDIDNPAVRRFKATDGSIGYGGISPPCAAPCISPLHTHFQDGVLHTEAKENQFNTLGEFFTQWAVRLDRSCVGATASRRRRSRSTSTASPRRRIHGRSSSRTSGRSRSSLARLRP